MHAMVSSARSVRATISAWMGGLRKRVQRERVHLRVPPSVYPQASVHRESTRSIRLRALLYASNANSSIFAMANRSQFRVKTASMCLRAAVCRVRLVTAAGAARPRSDVVLGSTRLLIDPMAGKVSCVRSVHPGLHAQTAYPMCPWVQIVTPATVPFPKVVEPVNA